MTRFFKFIEKKDLHYLTGGSFRFGRLKKYRLLEVINNDPWIGDKEEGVRKTNLDVGLVDTANPELLAGLKDAGIAIAKDLKDIVLSNITVSNEVDCFVFSLCEGELNELSTVMSDPTRTDFSYDGCVEILDIKGLVQRIFDEGECAQGRVSDIFRVYCGRVEYEDQVAHQFTSNLRASPADPFKKRTRFRSPTH